MKTMSNCCSSRSIRSSSADWGGDVAPAPLLPTLKLRDRQLHHLALTLAAEHRSSMPTGRLCAESLMTALLLRLVSIRNGPVGDRLSDAGWRHPITRDPLMGLCRVS
jgi:hypothetical protein